MFRIRVVSYQKILNNINPSEITRILSASDLKKAERFHFIEDKHRFIAARVLFLLVLNDIYRDKNIQIDTIKDISEYSTDLNIGSQEVNQSEISDLLPLTFSYNKYGKPEHQRIPFHFNWSHSGDMVALTIGEQHVGIDVEQYSTRPLFDYKSLCTAKELLWIADQTQNKVFDEKMAFLMIWSAKEAVLKAIGTGLSIDPRHIEITHDMNEKCWSSEVSGQILYGISTQFMQSNHSYALSWCSPKPDVRDLALAYISSLK